MNSSSQADGFSESESGSIEPVVFLSSQSLVEPEPSPESSDSPAMWDLVIKSLQEVLAVARQRDEFGVKKYGTRLQAFNGRRALVDAFQESLDQTVYLQQEVYEREFIDKVVDAAIAFSLNLNSDNEENLMNDLFRAVRDLLEVRGKR